MTNEILIDRLRTFTDFGALPDEAGEDLTSEGQLAFVESGFVMSRQGDSMAVYPLVLSGRARIFVMDEDGREITLYRLEPGDGCVLAATCAISETPSPGFSVVEAAGEALLIPATALRNWVDRHPFWRDYVFSLIARQLGAVVAVTNELAFRRLDTRIAGFLLRSAGSPSRRIEMTHQAIALEVGTRREVVSRILKGLEQEGLLRLERGSIEVRDPGALAARAGATIDDSVT